MLTQLKQITKKSKTAIIGYNIYNNWKDKKRFNSGCLETSSGTGHSNRTLSESLNYVNDVFDDYFSYSDISHEMIRNKRILEIGPGDNLGVALKFLSIGAAQVVCLDKFYSKRDTEQEFKIYQALRAQIDDVSKQRLDKVINLTNGIKIDPNRLRCIYGMAIEDVKKEFNSEYFDFIVSRAVVEHLYDTESAFFSMDRLLIPGGVMVHKIDFRDHGMFSSYGLHPFTFLTIPDGVYRLMKADSGKPNRRLINYYREKMIELNYDIKIFITQIVGNKEPVFPHKERIELGVDYSKSSISLINEIRPKLNKKFKDLSDEEIMITGIFLVGRKPK